MCEALIPWHPEYRWPKTAVLGRLILDAPQNNASHNADRPPHDQVNASHKRDTRRNGGNRTQRNPKSHIMLLCTGISIEFVRRTSWFRADSWNKKLCAPYPSRRYLRCLLAAGAVATAKSASIKLRNALRTTLRDFWVMALISCTLRGCVSDNACKTAVSVA